MPTQCLWTPADVTAAAERGRPGLERIVNAIPIEKPVEDLHLLDAYNAQVIDRRPSTRVV